MALTENEYFVKDTPTSFNGIYNALIVTLSELYLEVCKIPKVIDTFYICYGNNIILGRYKGYYDEQKIYQKNPRYSDLWCERKIYQ